MSTIELAHDLYLLLAVLGLALAVAHAGLPMLAQSAFMAVGGIGALQLERLGLPIGSAVVVAVAGGAAIGSLTGLLIGRASAAAVALTSWGLAWLAYTALLTFPGLSGGAQGLTRPAVDHLSAVFGLTITLTPTAHLVLAALLCLLALAGSARLRRGPAGLDVAALRDDRELAVSLGVRAVTRRMAVMAICAGVAALAGAGISLLLGVAAPADLSPLLSLQLLAAVIVGGSAPLVGPVLGLVVIVAIPRLADWLTQGGSISDQAAAGVITAAILVACIALRPRVTALRGRAWRHDDAPRAGAARATAGDAGDAASAGAPPENDAASAAAPLAAAAPARPQAGALLLAARGLHCRIGDVEILRGLDLELRAGEIHALIGANGSGKTTALRVLAGELAPSAGALEGERVRRSFQRTHGFASLSPYSQVLAAARAGDPAPGGSLLRFAGMRDAEREAAEDRRVRAALALVGLGERAQDDPQRLGPGEQRLLQVARVAATGARVLALDEPAVGMGPQERERLLAALRELAAQGCAVLVVEHDLRLVAANATVVTVIDEGRVLAHGAPGAVIGDERVREVYLGVAA